MSWKNDRPTCRQLKLIKDIEAEFGEQFTGTTTGEAADYIDMWLKTAKQDINRSINSDAEFRFG